MGQLLGSGSSRRLGGSTQQVAYRDPAQLDQQIQRYNQLLDQSRFQRNLLFGGQNYGFSAPVVTPPTPGRAPRTQADNERNYGPGVFGPNQPRESENFPYHRNPYAFPSPGDWQGPIWQEPGGGGGGDYGDAPIWWDPSTTGNPPAGQQNLGPSTPITATSGTVPTTATRPTRILGDRPVGTDTQDTQDTQGNSVALGDQFLSSSLTGGPTLPDDGPPPPPPGGDPGLGPGADPVGPLPTPDNPGTGEPGTGGYPGSPGNPPLTPPPPPPGTIQHPHVPLPEQPVGLEGPSGGGPHLPLPDQPLGNVPTAPGDHQIDWSHPNRRLPTERVGNSFELERRGEEGTPGSYTPGGPEGDPSQGGIYGFLMDLINSEGYSPAEKEAMRQQSALASQAAAQAERARMDRRASVTGNTAGLYGSQAQLGSALASTLGEQERRNQLAWGQEQERRHELGGQGLQALYNNETGRELSLMGGASALAGLRSGTSNLDFGEEAHQQAQGQDTAGNLTDFLGGLLGGGRGASGAGSGLGNLLNSLFNRPGGANSLSGTNARAEDWLNPNYPGHDSAQAEDLYDPNGYYGDPFYDPEADRFYNWGQGGEYDPNYYDPNSEYFFNWPWSGGGGGEVGYDPRYEDPSYYDPPPWEE
jgi:hypothetical protein